MKIISSDSMGNELLVTTSSIPNRMMFCATHGPGRKRVIVYSTPADARKFAVAIVRIADTIDPAGTIVVRRSAWKKAAAEPPPEAGRILAGLAFGHIGVVERRFPFNPWQTIDGKPINVFEWAEIPE